MTMANRARGRNIHLFDASTGASLGGAYQAGSLTDANLLWILSKVLIVAPAQWTLKHRESGRVVAPSSSPVAHGEYDIHSNEPIQITTEVWRPRAISNTVYLGPGAFWEDIQEDAFCEGLRARDGGCVISGKPNLGAQYNSWVGYDAAHIFPEEYEGLWLQNGYGRWITVDDAVGVSKIDSLQNGFTMSKHYHTLYGQCLISINPDDNYKIISFMPDTFGIDGKTLAPACRAPANPHRVSDAALRWHFRQAVLANMRGAGEPTFETDFSSSYITNTIRAEPCAKERLELELALRLRAAAREGKVSVQPTLLLPSL